MNDAAMILGCGPATVRRLVRAGELVVKDRVNGAHMFYRCDVERLVGTVRRPPDPLNRCGLCDRPLDGTAATHGPLGARLCPPCAPELARRTAQALDSRYCPICDGERVVAMPGSRLDITVDVPCLCTPRPQVNPSMNL